MFDSKGYKNTLRQFDFQDLIVELGSLVAAIDAGLLTAVEKKEYAEKKRLVMAEIATRPGE